MAKRNANRTELQQEIASYDRDVTYPSFFGSLLQIVQNQDPTLLTRGGGKGLKLYDEIERDTHAYAVLEKRKNAVISREWMVDPASDAASDRAIADEIKGMLSNLKFDKLCKELLDAILKGYAVVEPMWQPVGNRLVPTHFYARDQRRFVFDTDRNLRMLTPQDGINGIALPRRKFIVHTVGGKDGTPYGLGLGSKLFWPVFFKKQDITFWLVFADKFGSPTVAGKYDASATKTEQKKLLSALQSISQRSAIIFPKGMEADLMEAQRSGAGDFYERLARYMDEQISEAVLGETLTTNIGTVGSRAASETHNEVRIEVAKGDSDLLSDTLNETLIKWIVELNWPGSEPPTVWRDFSEPEDLKTRAQRDLLLDRLGWELEDDKFIEVYGDGYRRKPSSSPAQQVPEPEPPPAPASKNRPAEPPAEFGEEQQRSLFRRFLGWLGFAEPGQPVEDQRRLNRDKQQEFAEAGEALAQDWQNLLGPRIQELRTLLDETQDLELFRERLAEFLEAEPSPEVVRAVERATFAGYLLGRAPQTKDQ